MWAYFSDWGGCGCDCRTRLWPRGPCWQLIGHGSGESHNSCGGTFRLRNCGTTRPRGVACTDSNIFQHIPTYSNIFQHIPPVKVRLLGICPKMGYPLNPWNSMVYHHFSTSRLLFWGMSQWATPLDHCSTLFLEDAVNSTPPSFSRTKFSADRNLDFLTPLKKKKKTDTHTQTNSIKWRLCGWPPLSSLNRLTCIILVVEDRLVLLIIEPQTKMGHHVTGRVASKSRTK